MKIKIKDIAPNPFRDFSLYPIDKEQVQRLRQSINDLGFFSGVTARRTPGGRGYQLAAGHHRLKAAEKEGLDEVEAVVNDYTDEKMVAVMVVENMTQRGVNAAATQDSVAAYAHIVSRAILLGDEDASRFLEVSDARTLGTAQAKIAQDGPGAPIMYRAINGFSLAERKERRGDDDKAEIMSQGPIEAALASLKQGGVMGRIVAEALKDVQAIRAERDAEAAEQEERRRKAEEREEAARVREQERATAELDRKRIAAEAAQAKAEAAKLKAAQQEGERKEAAKRAAREAEERRKEAAAAHKRAEKEEAEQRKKAEKERAEAKKIDLEYREMKAAEAERRRKEAEAVKEQKALDKVYDPRCVHVFRLSSHEAVFRRGVLSEGGRLVIPVDKQFELAKRIRADMEVAEKNSRGDPGSHYIDVALSNVIEEGLGLQRKADKEERERLLQRSHIDRVNTHWTTIRRGLQQAEQALQKLIEEQNQWQYEKRLFPMDLNAIERIGGDARRLQ